MTMTEAAKKFNSTKLPVPKGLTEEMVALIALGAALDTEENDFKPTFPTDGKVIYCGKEYYRHVIKKDGHHVSVTVEGGDFYVRTEQLTDL